MRLTREADLAADWGLTRDQFRTLRKRHHWAHVRFSRVDIRYTDEQIEQIVRDATARDAAARETGTGQTARSARRAS